MSVRGATGHFRLGFFTRMVDDAAPAEIYARALELFETAEDLGYDAGWVAQHHVHNQGGLPSPLIFLTAAAARTRRVKLVTGIITTPLENPLRLAEDASVLDILSGGRLELGFGTGGNEAVFTMFGKDVNKRQTDYDRVFDAVRDALLGKEIGSSGQVMFPPNESLTTRFWEATFHVEGGIRAARHGSGLLLSRTMPRPMSDTGTFESIDVAQQPIVDAYLQHLAGSDVAPRISLSRTVYVAPTRAEAYADAEAGMRRYARNIGERGGFRPEMTIDEIVARSDFHIGDPEDVIASLRADQLLPVATDVTFQVHPVDDSPTKTLRSFELVAREVAPALGWRPSRESAVTPGGRVPLPTSPGQPSG